MIDTLGRGGAEQVLVNLLPVLKKNGIQIEVISLMEPSPLAAELEKQGIPVHLLRLSNRWNLLEGFFKLRKVLKNKQFDIIHGHLFFGGIYSRILRMWYPNAKVVYTLHGFEFDRDLPDTFWHRIRLRMRKRILKRAHRLVAITAAVKEHYEHALGDILVQVISNPVVVPRFEKTKTTSETKKKQIVVPARLIPEKGHLIMLEALSLLLLSGVQFRCSFLGEGPERATIEEKIFNLGLSDCIFLRGQLSHDDLLIEVFESDWVVLPSLSEGFGLAAAEAMAMGKPVIASNTGGLVNLIESGKTGILVPAHDPSALFRAMKDFAEEKLPILALGVAAKVSIERKFSREQIALAWEKLYQEICP